MSNQVTGEYAIFKEWEGIKYRDGKYVMDWSKACKEYWKHVHHGNFWTDLEEDNESKQ